MEVQFVFIRNMYPHFTDKSMIVVIDESCHYTEGESYQKKKGKQIIIGNAADTNPNICTIK